MDLKTSTPQPKVLQIVTRLNIGGPAVIVTILTREMPALGYTTRLITGVCEESEGDMSYLLEPGDPVTFVPSLSRSVRPLNNFRSLLRLIQIIRAEHPDIVHTHTAMAGCLGRAAAIVARVPVIIHTFHGNSLREYFSPVVSAMFLRIERLLARFTDTICVLSDQQMDELSGVFQIAERSRFRVVPLGLDLHEFQAMASALRDGCLRVGWFGRLVDVKNIPLLVDAIAATVEQSTNIEFHIAGDGPDRNLIAAAVERFSPRVVWHGWVKDITPLVERCHVLIQTSRNEGTPVALIQGMAAARPFVSTAVGGIVDMISGPPLETQAGVAWHRHGILVNATPGAFASALMRLSRDPAQLAEMGEHARRFACERYRKDVLAANLDSIYRECLARKFPPAPKRNTELLKD